MSVLTQSPVVPHGVNDAANRTIVDTKDVILYLHAFEQSIKVIPVESEGHEGADVVFASVPSDGQLRAAGENDISVWKFSIGPLEISISVNLATLGASLTVSLNIPIIGTVRIASVSGSLKEGISVKIGYPGILSGEVGVKVEGRDVILFWEFTAFGKKFKGQVKAFSI